MLIALSEVCPCNRELLILGRPLAGSVGSIRMFPVLSLERLPLLGDMWNSDKSIQELAMLQDDKIRGLGGAFAWGPWVEVTLQRSWAG